MSGFGIYPWSLCEFLFSFPLCGHFTATVGWYRRITTALAPITATVVTAATLVTMATFIHPSNVVFVAPSTTILEAFHHNIVISLIPSYCFREPTHTACSPLQLDVLSFLSCVVFQALVLSSHCSRVICMQ